MAQVPSQFVHTADYSYIEAALKARWEPFSALASELESFVPKTIADFHDYRKDELERLQLLNPDSSDEELLKHIDGQIQAKADPGKQLWFQFADRIMAEYVTVAFLSHALAEATINAILAIGLANSGSPELFAVLERADIKEKWVAGPKAFCPTYSLAKDGALYQTLHHLSRQRNAFVHYKIELEVNGEKKFDGSRLDRAPLSTQIIWIRRFFSLPYDLAAQARAQIPNSAFILFDCRPIQLFSTHAAHNGYGL